MDGAVRNSIQSQKGMNGQYLKTFVFCCSVAQSYPTLCNLTSDGSNRGATVSHHPSVDIPHIHPKPTPRPDPVHDNEETHGAVLKTRSEDKSEHSVPGPRAEQLSKMLFSTKQHWNPRGQNHRRGKELNPPKTDDVEAFRNQRGTLSRIPFAT
ncbi:hypothetical protein FD755_020855 [Muntiacus reevesi]|uniref:Large ribosomal subunit protein mL42 n=1 Tax=Muntiacus reevesi TaxID=9886 RepID=A0A5N3X0Z1_MUNRE|nr:hypothetical protein FD755_020855 [Muntiacus reevesi]